MYIPETLNKYFLVKKKENNCHDIVGSYRNGGKQQIRYIQFHAIQEENKADILELQGIYIPAKIHTNLPYSL